MGVQAVTDLIDPKESFLSSPLEIKIGNVSMIIFEQCDRHCSHCGSAATKKLPGFDFEGWQLWVKFLEFSKKIDITGGGEPFFARSVVGEETKTLGDFLELICEKCEKISISTSGINFSSKDEIDAAEKIVNSERIRTKLDIRLTLNDFVRLRGPLTGQQMQVQTASFLARNGINFTIRTFLDETETNRRLRLAGLDYSAFTIERDGVLLDIGRNAQEDVVFRDFQSITGCLLGNSKIEDLGITANGLVIPPCCVFFSHFIGIAHLNEISDMQELRSKASEFSNRLRRIYREKLEQGKNPNPCIECMALAPMMGNRKILRRIIGERAARAVFEKRLGR